MGKTITEKILAKAAGKKTVSPGEYLEVTSRCPTPIGNAGSLRGGIALCAEWGVGVFNPDLIKWRKSQYLFANLLVRRCQNGSSSSAFSIRRIKADCRLRLVAKLKITDLNSSSRPAWS